MAEEPSATHPQPRKSRVAATLRAIFRTRITAGLLVALPIYVTVLLIKFVFGLMRDSSLWVVEAYLRSSVGQPLLESWKVGVSSPAGGQKLVSVATALRNFEERLGRVATREEFLDILPQRIEWGIAIVSVLLTIIILYAIGLFTANIFGRRVIGWLEHLVDRVPLVKTIYRSSKQILITFTGEQSQNFQRVALVPFPQEKMRSVGFITGIFRDSVTGEELAAVFIPTTPNPTTGFVQILRRNELLELDWSVEDAVRIIMSGGILRPDFLTMAPGPKRDDLPETPPTSLPGSPPSNLRGIEPSNPPNV